MTDGSDLFFSGICAPYNNICGNISAVQQPEGVQGFFGFIARIAAAEKYQYTANTAITRLDLFSECFKFRS